MTLRQTLTLFLKWSPLVVVLGLIGGVVGYATASQTTLYSATTTVYVGAQTPSTDPAESNGNILAFDQLLVTLCAITPSKPVASLAVSAPGAGRSAEQAMAETTAHVVANSDLIDIVVIDQSPSIAAGLSNRMANALVSYTQASSSVITEPMRVFQPATVPTAPFSAPSHKKRTVEGALLGAVLALLAVFLIDSLRRPRPSSDGAAAGGADDV